MRDAGTHINSPPSCWSSSGVKPNEAVVSRCGAYSGAGANVSSAPSRPICTIVASSAATAAGALAPRSARQNDQAAMPSVACISQ